MVRQRFWPGLMCVVLVAALSVGTKSADAVGYFNMPGDFCQWAGHGFSGGYHAPFVLGPVRTDHAVYPNVTRLSRAPNPYACAPYCGVAGGGYGSGIAAPTEMPLEPQMMPAR